MDDYQGDAYEHRYEDDHGNGDDLYTEKEALAIAKEEGIEFVDTFSVSGDEKNREFEARDEAVERALELGLDELSVIQTRKRKAD